MVVVIRGPASVVRYTRGAASCGPRIINHLYHTLSFARQAIQVAEGAHAYKYGHSAEEPCNRALVKIADKIHRALYPSRITDFLPLHSLALSCCSTWRAHDRHSLLPARAFPTRDRCLQPTVR